VKTMLSIVETHVKEAVDQGAKVVAGGARTGPGLGYQATVLDRCTQQMKVVADETFGPVLAVVRVKDAEEAVRLANDSRYGLNGSVWTKDLAKGEALARRLEVGVALVNNHGFTGILPELPWTGTKETGTGVASSKHAYASFVRRRAVLVDKNKNPDPWWAPADENSKGFADALARMAMGQMGAMFELLGMLPKRVKSIKTLAGG
jgi:acyl-CoA reductase-like NAD-dependent aldehyde dehydrogenase